MKLGEAIKYYRQLRGLDIKQFASRVGLSLEQYRKLENGESGTRVERFFEILNQLDCMFYVRCPGGIKITFTEFRRQVRLDTKKWGPDVVINTRMLQSAAKLYKASLIIQAIPGSIKTEIEIEEIK